MRRGIVPLSVRRQSGTVDRVGVDETIATSKEAPAAGIYQSSCACRTALSVQLGDTMPHCVSCEEIVVWRLVQEVHAVRKESGTRLISSTSRPQLDSASSE